MITAAPIRISGHINCRYCNGRRPLSSGGVCCGCGSFAELASTTRTRRRRHCPKCTDGVMQIHEISKISVCGSCSYDAHEQSIDNMTIWRRRR